jgi:putative hemolysin
MNSTQTVQADFLSIAASRSAQPFVQSGPYCLRLATSEHDRLAALRLRFSVFNLELNEGLDSAYATGCDLDAFDAVCDHLIVEHELTGRVVGTYRLQTGAMAAANLGYYSEREFDFRPYAALRREMVELGRACVHRDYRSTEVLLLLWKGVVSYGMAHGSRYFIGCCSLTSQDPAEGAAVYTRLLEYQVEPALQTTPVPEFCLQLTDNSAEEQQPPKLLRSYLALGAKICGPPAIDREFKTIDFLTLMDLNEMHPRVRSRLLGI